MSPMKQNKYDDPAFFARYSEMARSVGGLQAAAEWPAFRGLLPDLRDKRVLDLGCGFGWHCRYAREQGARSVVGVDLSEKMLRRAGQKRTICESRIGDVQSKTSTSPTVNSTLSLVRWRSTMSATSMLCVEMFLAGSHWVARLCCQLNIRCLPQARPSSGALVQQVSDCIGLLTITNRKAYARANG